MRKCLRCGSEMKEDCVLRGNFDSDTLTLYKRKKFIGGRIGGVTAAVCPQCGEVSLYVDDTEKLND